MGSSFLAWGIDTRSGDGPRFIGRYWHFEDGRPCDVTGAEGYPPALFKTRREAVAKAKEIRGNGKGWSPYPKARPVRVRVQIEAVEAATDEVQP